jgi:hypothetical protein
MKNLERSWDFKIGETEIYDTEKNISYVLIVGYVEEINFDEEVPLKSLLYFRVYYKQNDELIIGAWVEHCKEGAPPHSWFRNIREKATNLLSLKILNQCVACAERMEKLKVFV